jgi:hypothetical protein
MRMSRCVLALAFVAVAACGREASPVAAPDQPLRSTWTRTYSVWGTTWQGTALNRTPALFSGGYVLVELVPDGGGPPTELGQVESGEDIGSFYKPANYSIRLTAVPTGSGCTFRNWLFYPSSVGTTDNPVNMDNWHSYSQVRGDFLCP